MIPRHSARFFSIGVAAALALGVTATAEAQSSTTSATDTTTAVSQQRIPVTKQQGIYDTTTSTGTVINPHDTTTRSGMDTTMTDTTGVVTDTSTAMPTDTAVTPNATVPSDTTTRTDTSVVPGESTSVSTSTTTITHTEADTVGIYPSGSRLGRLGRGFWIGVGGGATVPMGNLHDGGYDTGWNITVPIGWQSATTPWGLRLDLSYDRLNGGTLATVPVSVTLSDANVWSGALDLTLQFPFGRSGSSFYLMGGGGIHHFTDVKSDNGAAIIDGTALSSSGDESLTKAGINGGAGLNFGFGRAKLFLESRFVSVFTQGKNSNYVPIILGVRVF